MKHGVFLFILIFFCSIAFAVYATETQTFILKDGTKIRGKLVELNNGVYIIKTPDGAQTRIRAKKVSKITTPKKKADHSKKTDEPKKTEPKEAKSIDPFARVLNSNPKIMEELANFKNPKILGMLQDSEFQAAVKEIKDPKQFETDPRTKEFYTNPEIKALLKKYTPAKKKKTSSKPSSTP